MTAAEIDWLDIGRRFREPMATHSYKGKGGMAMTYITARQAADRLDEVVGPGAWSTAFQVLQLNPPAVECTLTIHGVSKADVGYNNDPGSEREDEPLKAAYSDALKRAAVQWGIGRFLYGDTAPSAPAARPVAPVTRAAQPMPQVAAVPPKQAVDDDPLITDNADPLVKSYATLAQQAAELGLDVQRDWMLTLPLHRAKLVAQGKALRQAVENKSGVPA